MLYFCVCPWSNGAVWEQTMFHVLKVYDIHLSWKRSKKRKFDLENDKCKMLNIVETLNNGGKGIVHPSSDNPNSDHSIFVVHCLWSYFYFRNVWKIEKQQSIRDINIRLNVKCFTANIRIILCAISVTPIHLQTVKGPSNRNTRDPWSEINQSHKQNGFFIVDHVQHLNIQTVKNKVQSTTNSLQVKTDCRCFNCWENVINLKKEREKERNHLISPDPGTHKDWADDKLTVDLVVKFCLLLII